MLTLAAYICVALGNQYQSKGDLEINIAYEVSIFNVISRECKSIGHQGHIPREISNLKYSLTWKMLLQQFVNHHLSSVVTQGHWSTQESSQLEYTLLGQSVFKYWASGSILCGLTQGVTCVLKSSFHYQCLNFEIQSCVDLSDNSFFSGSPLECQSSILTQLWKVPN